MFEILIADTVLSLDTEGRSTSHQSVSTRDPEFPSNTPHHRISKSTDTQVVFRINFLPNIYHCEATGAVSGYEEQIVFCVFSLDCQNMFES